MQLCASYIFDHITLVMSCYSNITLVMLLFSLLWHRGKQRKTKSPNTRIMKENQQKQQKEDIRRTEVCALCKGTITYPFDLPILQRQHYFEGAGQLCPTCYKNVYGDLK